MVLRRLVCASFLLAVASAVACSSSDSGFKGFAPPPPSPSASGTADAGAADDAPGTPPPPSMNDAGGMAHDASQPGKDAGGNPPPPKDAAPPPVDANPPGDGFDQFQHHNLDVVNMYRATKGVAPLVLDKQLCDFALAGTQELTQDHMPHQHFMNASNDGSLWMLGFTSAAAENQGDPNGWTVLSQDPTQNELLQIDDIQKAMFDEGPGGGHYDNIMNATYKRLGVGLTEVNASLYLTNDFSD